MFSKTLSSLHPLPLKDIFISYVRGQIHHHFSLFGYQLFKSDMNQRQEYLISIYFTCNLLFGRFVAPLVTLRGRESCKQNTYSSLLSFLNGSESSRAGSSPQTSQVWPHHKFFLSGPFLRTLSKGVFQQIKKITSKKKEGMSKR